MVESKIQLNFTAVPCAGVVDISRLMRDDSETAIKTLIVCHDDFACQFKRHRRRSNVHLRIERKPA